MAHSAGAARRRRPGHQPGPRPVRRRSEPLQPLRTLDPTVPERAVRRSASAETRSPEHGDHGGELIDWPVAGRAKLGRLRAAYEDFVANGSATDRADLRPVPPGLRRGPRAPRPSSRPCTPASSPRPERAGLAGVAGAIPRPGRPRGGRLRPRPGGRGGLPRLPAVAGRPRPGAGPGDRPGSRHGDGPGRRSGRGHGCGRQPRLEPARRPAERALGVGAPPDVFQPAGQDWGLAAFSPQALRWERLRTPSSPLCARPCTTRAAIRIDHAMGLRRLWLVRPRRGRRPRRLPPLSVRGHAAAARAGVLARPSHRRGRGPRHRAGRASARRPRPRA